MPNPAVVVDFVANTKDLQRASGELGSSGSKIGGAFRKAAVPAVAALGAIAAGAHKAVDAASSLNEQVAASGQVFGENSKAMQDWAATGSEAFGLSQTEALRAANAYGNMFSTIGLGAKDTQDMSKQMVQLAGDMASFHDQDPTEMLAKLRSGLSGEAEPLRQFGVLISDAAVKQKAYAEGIAQNGAELTEAQKVQARYALIMEQSTKAQGDFARTGDSVANQQRTLAAENENVTASFGQSLLPAMQAFQQILQTVLGGLGEHKTTLTALIGILTGLAAVVLLVNGAMAVYGAGAAVVTAATKAWEFAQLRLNLAFLTNPIFLVIAAVIALVAAFVLAWKHSETFRKIVTGAFDAVLNAAKAAFGWVKENWPLLLAILTGPIGIAALAVIKNWHRIKQGATDAVDAIKGAFSSLLGWFGGFLEKIKGTAGAVANAIKGPINSVVDAWNKFAIPRFEITIPKIKVAGRTLFGGGSFGFGPFEFPDIPRLARGGIVDRPTLALIGEAGPEAVVPLSDAQRPSVQVRVFIGDRELTDLVRTEITDANTGLARTLLAG